MFRSAWSVCAAVVIALAPVPAYAAPAGPVLTAPTEGDIVSANPVFSWLAVPGALRYHIDISTSPDYSSPAYSKDTYNLHATPPADLPLGTIYWRIRAIDAANTPGPYVGSSFTKQASGKPTPISPADGATLSYPDDPPVFAWTPLPGAVKYTLEIDDAADFIGATSITNIVNPTYTLTEPQTIGQTFFWRVRGFTATGNASEWSDPRSYTVAWSAAPLLVTPPNTVAMPITDVVFEWQALAGAATYQLQVSPNGDWANNTVIDEIVKGTRHSPATTLNNGSYFWRVRGRDAKSTPNNGGWSDEWQFVRGWPDVPTLITPSDGDLDVTELTFTWTPVARAARYEMQWSSDINFSPGTVHSCFTNHTTVTPYGGTGAGSCDLDVNVGLLYYWRVHGIDEPQPVNGLFSDVQSFVFRPVLPGLLTPADGASTSAPVFRWEPVPDITKYKITILKANLSQAASAETSSMSWSPTAELKAEDGPFQWYVQTRDLEDRYGQIPAMSDWFTFTLTTPMTTFATPEPTGPADGSNSLRMPAMTWQPVTGATYYKVRYIAGGSDFLFTSGDHVPYAAFTWPGGILPTGTYAWYVQAYDDNGLISQSVAQRTFAILAPGLASYVSPAKCTLPSPCTTIDDTPTLVWDSVPEVGFYYVYLATDANFTNIVRTYTTQFTRLTPRDSLLDSQAGQAYYWFVRPCTAATVCGPFNGSVYPLAYAFRKQSAPVELLSPAAGATVANLPTFSWRDYLATNGDRVPQVTQEAKTYRIQVSPVSDFASILETEVVVDQTMYTPWKLTYPEGPLYWRVQAIDGSGNPLTFSAARLVTKSSPPVTLAAPAHGATVSGVPYLAWQPQPYAAQYDVEIYKNGDLDFSPVNKIVAASGITKMAAYAPTTALAAGDYAWRVRRLDANSRTGPWADPGRLFHLTPAAPTLLTPPNAALLTGHELLYQWTGIPGAASYRVERSTSPGFTSPISATTVMTSWAPTELLADSTYHWRVAALNPNGGVLATSAARSFSKDATRPTVTAKAPTTQAPYGGPFTVTFSEAVTGVTTTTFRMTVAGTPTAVGGTVVKTASNAAKFTPTSPLVPGQSYTLSLTSGITDVRGNPLVPFSWTVRTSLTVDQDDAPVIEVWDRDTSSAASGGAYAVTRNGGATATYTFTGTGVSILGTRSASGGYADVYLDGVLQTGATPVSFWSAATQWRVAVWKKAGLANTTHRVTLRARGTRPSASRDTYVYLDAFAVGATLAQENSAAVRQQFARFGNSTAYGGSFDTTSHVAAGDTGPAPYLQLTFRGTRITWYAARNTGSGKAIVFIDNVNRGTIDLYAASPSYHSSVFTSPTLTNALHTIRIIVTGTARTGARGAAVGFDSFRLV